MFLLQAKHFNTFFKKTQLLEILTVIIAKKLIKYLNLHNNYGSFGLYTL